jgi:hypothetical protein
MNYNELIEQIKAYSNRTDNLFTAQIPNFITQAISRIYSEAKTIGFQTIVAGNPTFTVGNALIAKPADWKETISLSYVIPGATPTRVYLLSRSYEFCQTYSPIENVTGDPIFYADYDLPTPGPGRIFLTPTPGVAYQYELIYLRLPAFNGANIQNFIADRYPSLILYASLLEAAPFLKDDERIAMFDARYNKELNTVLKDTTGRYTDRTSKRDKD